jgi:hypothetical protein
MTVVGKERISGHRAEKTKRIWDLMLARYTSILLLTDDIFNF